MARNTSNYIVRNYDGTGARYLVRRTTGSSRRYRWAKTSRDQAARLTYDAARKLVRSYNGVMVAV